MASKSSIIEDRKANLPLPEQPPIASDFNSSDTRTVNVNVGSGGLAQDISHSGRGGETLREPATTDSVGSTGREAKDGLEGLPSDAVAREAKGRDGVVGTEGKQ